MLPQIENFKKFMLPQIENFKKGYEIFIRRCNTANRVLWNSRFGNQGANNIVNLWLPDAMIKWSCTEFNGNTN